MQKIILVISAVMLNIAIGFATNPPIDSLTQPIVNSVSIKQKAENDSLLAATKETTIKPSKCENNETIEKIQQIQTLLLILVCLLFALSITVIIVIALKVLNSKKQRNSIVKIIQESKRIKEWRDEIKIDTNALQSNSFVEKFNSDIDNLRSRITILENEKNKIEKNEIAKQEEILAASTMPQTLYADVIIGDKFNKVTSDANETSIYQLLLKTPSATTAEFTLYNKNKKQILRNPDKIDGCEKRGTNAGAIDVIVEAGKVQKNDIGSWQITKKAIIKFV